MNINWDYANDVVNSINRWNKSGKLKNVSDKDMLAIINDLPKEGDLKGIVFDLWKDSKGTYTPPKTKTQTIVVKNKKTGENIIQKTENDEIKNYEVDNDGKLSEINNSEIDLETTDQVVDDKIDTPKDTGGIRYGEENYNIDLEKSLIDDLIRFSDKISFNKDAYGNIVMVGIPITKSEFRSKFINDLKKGGNINSNDMSIIIDKVVKNLTEYIDINDYDYIVSPKSSSDLTKTFIEKLNTLSNKPTFVNDMFIKNDVDDIWLDIETAQKELSGKYFKKLIKDFDKAKGMEGQPIKLQPLTNFQRKYVKNMLKINSDYDNVVLSMLDKKILVIDDILTSGKTLDEIKTLLSNLNTKEITLFSMFI
jgi:hypothetical protein